MSRLHLDGETASALSLPDVGLHAYLEHPSTRVWCVAWAFDHEPPVIWRPGMPVPERVTAHIRAGGEVWAHNAPFERWMVNLILVREGWPPLTREQMHCTMAMCAAMAIPLSLDRASAALGLPVRKDLEGKRIMLFLAQPDEDGNYRTPDKYPEYHARLDAYCIQDVVVEMMLGERTLALSPFERSVWLMDQRINDRGVMVDEPVVKAALALVKTEEARLNGAIERVTGGHVSTTNCHVALREWVEKAGGPAMPGVAKDDVEQALKREDLPVPVRLALELRHEAAKSSTKKLKPMLLGRCLDGLMRGLFQFCGAGRTLRFSGRRAQVQNYPRQLLLRLVIDFFLDNPARLTERFCRMFEIEPMKLVSELLRGMLIACPGTRFIAVDLAQIEARFAAWLAGDEGFLEEFRGRGKVYERDAAAIYGVDVSSISKGDERRQVGKVSGLAFQYGGGVNAFRNMGKIYKIPHFSDAAIEGFRDTWRAAHAPIVRYWARLEAAAINAVRNPGTVRAANFSPLVRYVMNGSFLFCQAPSGSVACYPYPRIENVETPWGELKPALTYQTIKEEGKGEGRDWTRDSTWGGKLFENLVQRAARDLFVYGMLRAESGLSHGYSANYPLVMHGHDEAVARMKHGEGSLDELCAIMATLPPWAAGLPVAADGWEGPRYRK